MKLEKIKYSELSSKAKESYNFPMIAAKLALYGYECLWLNNDTNGADFIAVHCDHVNEKNMMVQLKSRLSFSKKYEGKGIYMTFRLPATDEVYLYPHDEIKELIVKHDDNTWLDKGSWSTGTPSKWMLEVLEPYKI
jgi:hypothetical protein